MKRFIFLFSFLFFIHSLTAQIVTGTTEVTSIDCNSGFATWNITTNATVDFRYEIYVQNPGGSWTPFWPSTLVNVPPNDFDVSLFAGTFQVHLFDVTGTIPTDTSLAFTVNQPGPLFNTFTLSTTVSCFGGADGTATVNPIGGTPPYTFLWSDGQTTNPATGLSEGTYTCTISDANNCPPLIVSVLITEPTELTSSITGTDVSCFGGSDGTATVTPSGGTSGYTFLWSDGQTTNPAIGLSDGTYSCTITDANGCAFTTSLVTISEPSAPLTVPTPTGTDVSCFGGSDGTATVSPSGGTPGYIFSWSDGQTTNPATGLSAGTYDCIITDANGCGPVTVSVTISEPSAPLIASITGTDVSCFGGSDGTATVTPSGGTSGYTFSWSDGQTTNPATGLSAGTYDCIITDANGCTFITSLVTISQPSAPLTASIIGADVSCFGGANGTAIVNPSGGTPGYTFLWDPAAGSQTTQTAVGLSAGTYNCIITDANGCTVTPSVTISQPSAPLTSPITGTDVSCFGGSDGTATVTPSGGTSGYTFLWSDGQATNPATGLSAGTYTCTVTDANGCIFTTSLVTISQPFTSLIASITGTDVSCFGGSDGTATVSPSGGTPGYTFLWSDGQATNPATGLSAGTYTCTVTDANGCTFTTSTVTISQPSTPLTASITGTDASCFSGTNGTATVTPSGGTPGYTFLWDPAAGSQTTQTAVGLSAGTYSCAITDANGCTVTPSITISQPSAPLTASITGTDVSCFGGTNGTATVTPSGGTSGYTFLWSDGNAQTTQTAVGLSAGTYSCTITDANGCPPLTVSVTISQPSAPLTASITGADVSCFGGANGTATVTPSGGTSGYTFLWSDGSAQTTQTAVGLSAGTYSCTITDANGCTFPTSSVTISQPSAALTAPITGTDVSCFGGTNGTATISPSGGTPGYTFLWSTGQTTNPLTLLSAGTYTCLITDANGCFTNESVTINQSSQLQVPITGTEVSCNGGSDAIATASPTGGTPPYTYSWDNGQTTQTATGLSAGTYIVTITDGINCPDVSSSITINEPAAITVLANIDFVSCFSGSDGQISLSVSGGNAPYTYLWSDTQTSSNATGLVAGTYTVAITDLTCSTPTIFTYDVDEPSTILSATTVVSDVECFGGNDGSITLTTLGGTPPYTYSWDNGQNSQSLTNLVIGTYTCTITDFNGCIAFATATVDQPQEITLPTSTVPVSCFGYNDGTATVNPQGGTGPYTYFWSNTQTTQTAVDLVAGSYNVMVLDDNLCAASTSITIGQPVQVNATLIPTNILCNGDSSGVITVNNVTGTTGPYTYTWSNGSNSAVNQNLSAGNYYVTINDGNGCSNTFSQTLTQPLPVSPNLVYSDISVNGANDGSISTSVSGGTFPYSYSWSGPNNYVNNNPNINSLEVGVYTLIITDANGCSQTFNQVINEPNCNVVISQTYTAPLCYGDMATVYWQNSGGAAPYSNTLISSDGTILINGAQYDYPNTPLQLPSGVYDLVVEDASGCSAIWNIEVSTPDSLALSLLLSDALCYGDPNGTASVSINGGVTPYVIDWGSSDPNLLMAGSYNIQVTDANGCFTIVNYTINQPAQLVIDSVATTEVSCTPGNDGTATIYGSGGILPYTYYWSNGQTSQTAQSLANGTYTAYIYDANNCEEIFNNVNISNATQLDVSIQQNDISCINGNDGSLSATLVNGTGPITYNWFNLSAPTTVISSDSFVLNLSAGGYSLLATDVNGCIDQGTVLLTNPTNITFGLNGSNTTSNSANDGWINTISVSGGQSPYTYYWAGPNGYTSTSQSIANLYPGTYTLTITDANGCTSSQSEVITEQSCTVLINSTITQPLCATFDGNITWYNSGGGGTYLNTLTDLTTNTVIYNTFGTSFSHVLSEGYYTLQVSDQYGCADLVNIHIQEPDALVADVTTNDVSCFGYSDGSVAINPLGGTPSYGIIPVIPNSLGAGMYSFILTDANGCSISQSFSISEPSDMITTITTSNVSCLNGVDGSATVNVSGGTAPFTYNWSPSGLTTQTVNTLTADNHYVTVIDAFGCTPSAGPDLVVINEPSLNLSATFNNINPSCYGYSDGTSQIVPAGGTSPYTYLWSNGQIMQQATGLSAGNYDCVVTDHNGCVDIFYTTIGQPTEIFSNIDTSNTSCYNTPDGSAVVNPSGGSGTYNVLWFDGSIGSSVSGLSIGSYNVTVTDNTGCSTLITPVTFDIYEPDSLLLTTSVISNPNCFGGSNGSVNVSVTGGTPVYNYTWIDVLNNTLSSDSFAVNLGVGDYNVIVTDINGCDDTASISLSSPGTILANITTDSTLCSGSSDGSATANPSGGTPPYSYIWTGTGSTSATSTGLDGSTLYYVSITDVNGCQTIDSVNIPEPLPISMSFTALDHNGYNTSCYGSVDAEITAIPAGGTSPYQFSFDNFYYTSSPIFSSATVPVSGIGAGWFDVYVKDTNECIFLDSIDVTGPAVIDPNIGILSNLVCSSDNNGALVSVPSGGVAPYLYLWSDGQTTQTATGLDTGVYFVTVTDTNQCSITDTHNLVPLFAVTLSFSTTNVTCFGSSDGTATISPSGGTPTYTYLWSDGQTTQTATGLDTGTYICTVTDINGCIAITDTINIFQSPTSLDIDSTLILKPLDCFGNSDASAIVYPSGGTPAYTYLWNDASAQTTQTAIGLSAGTYICTVTDYAGCAINDTVIIDGPAAPLSVISNAQDISCFGYSDGAINIFVSGGTSPYDISWEGPNSYSSNLDSIFDLEAGTYIFTITDANGCELVDSLFIIEPIALSFTVDVSNPLCYNDVNGMINIQINGGVQPYDAIYSSGVNTYPNSSSIVITGLGASSDTLYVIDANGCQEINFINIIEPLELEISTITIVDPTCYNYTNGSASIVITGGTIPYNYEVLDDYNNNIGFDSNISGLADGNYTYIINDLYDCMISTQFSITEPDQIEITQLESCYGSILIDVTNFIDDYQLFWNNMMDTVYIDSLSVGTYIATVIDNSGCTKIDSFIVNTPFSLNTYNATCLTVSDGLIEIQDINVGNPPYSLFVNSELLADDIINEISLNDLSATNYQVLLTDNSSCVLLDSLFVIDYIGGYECVDPPIVISPNGDGTNDTWRPAIDLDVDIYVTIYNRWGQIEFFKKANSAIFEWDGTTTDGRFLPTADYYFVIDFIDQDTMSDKTGVITLIR